MLIHSEISKLFFKKCAKRITLSLSHININLSATVKACVKKFLCNTFGIGIEARICAIKIKVYDQQINN